MLHFVMLHIQWKYIYKEVRSATVIKSKAIASVLINYQ